MTRTSRNSVPKRIHFEPRATGVRYMFLVLGSLLVVLPRSGNSNFKFQMVERVDKTEQQTLSVVGKGTPRKDKTVQAAVRYSSSPLVPLPNGDRF